MAETLFSANYTIKRVLELNQFLNVYAGEKKDMETVLPVIINEIVNRNMINQCIMGITDIDKSRYPDFVEYFSEESKLYAVFSYTAGKNIKKHLETENLNIRYRMVLYKHILHSFLEYVNYPVFVRISMMHHKNIVIQNNAVHFNYRFFSPDEEMGYTEEAFFHAMKELFDLFFSPAEIKGNNKLAIISGKFNKNVYSSVAEVIRDMEDAAGMADKDELLKETLLEKKKKMKQYAGKAMIAAMVIAAVCLLYHQFQNENVNVFQYNVVDKLGTVDVRENTGDLKREDTLIRVTSQRELPEQELIGSDEIGETIVIDDVDSADTEDHTREPVQLPETEDYIVVEGDTMYVLCLEKYKDISYLDALVEFNELEDRDFLSIGQVLKLPPVEVLAGGEVAENAFHAAGEAENLAVEPPETVLDTAGLETESETELDEYELLLEEEDYGTAYNESERAY